MAAFLVASRKISFADGDSGKAISLGTAPTVGDVDVLCYNSNTTVTADPSDPAGGAAFLTAGNNEDVGNQGMYMARRTATGGEGSTVVINTDGDHDTDLIHMRWRNIVAADDARKQVANGSAGGSSPAISTNALAEANELVIAMCGLHSVGAGGQATGVWSGGFDAVEETSIGTGSTGVALFVGAHLAAGTAAVSPSVTWSGPTANDRAIMTLSFTTSDDAPEEFTGSAELDTAVSVAASGRKQAGGGHALALAVEVTAAGHKVARGSAHVIVAAAVATSGRKLGRGAAAIGLAVRLNLARVRLVPGRLLARGTTVRIVASGQSGSTLVASGGESA